MSNGDSSGADMASKVANGEDGPAGEPLIYAPHRQPSKVYVLFDEMLKGFVFGLFNWHSLLVVSIALCSTILCSNDLLGIKLDTNMNTLSLGTIFPIVFTISQSYKRREEALQRLASLKANAYGIYWIQREWDPSRTNGAKVAAAVSHMFDSIRIFLHADTYDRQEALKGVYASMSACSLLNYEMTNNPATDTRPPCAPTHASRANQYIRYCINDFERMRVIRDYRTPEGLRLFATFLLHILPVILGPRFAEYCDADEDNYGCASSYFTAIMFFVVVLTLYHVQQDLEDPYDESGWDDIKLELTPEVQFLMSLHPDPKLLKHPGISPEVVKRMEIASQWLPRNQVTLPAEQEGQ